MIGLEQRLSSFSLDQSHLENLVKHSLLVPTSQVSNSLGWAWGPKKVSSDTFPGDAGAAGAGPQLKGFAVSCTRASRGARGPHVLS